MRFLESALSQRSPLIRAVVKIAMALGVERLATFSGWLIWFTMGVVGFQAQSIVMVFAVGLILELLHAQIILEIYLWGRRKGYDVTGVSDIKNHLNEPMGDKPTDRRSWWWHFQSFYKWLGRATLSSYWLMIVLGSNVYLGTDYVTLALIREGESRLSVFWRVMLPAAIASIAFGTLVVWGGLQGLWWTELT